MERVDLTGIVRLSSFFSS